MRHYVVAQHARTALVGPEQRGQHLERCRLPRAVRPQQAKYLPATHGKAEAVHSAHGRRALGFEDFYEVFYFNRVLRHCFALECGGLSSNSNANLLRRSAAGL